MAEITLGAVFSPATITTTNFHKVQNLITFVGMSEEVTHISLLQYAFFFCLDWVKLTQGLQLSQSDTHCVLWCSVSLACQWLSCVYL